MYYLYFHFPRDFDKSENWYRDSEKFYQSHSRAILAAHTARSRWANQNIQYGILEWHWKAPAPGTLNELVLDPGQFEVVEWKQ